eukprot:851768-Heterocapsa_arctica.AAC.1
MAGCFEVKLGDETFRYWQCCTRYLNDIRDRLSSCKTSVQEASGPLYDFGPPRAAREDMTSFLPRRLHITRFHALSFQLSL